MLIFAVCLLKYFLKLSGVNGFESKDEILDFWNSILQSRTETGVSIN